MLSPTTGALPKCLQQLAVGKAKVKSLHLNPDLLHEVSQAKAWESKEENSPESNQYSRRPVEEKPGGELRDVRDLGYVEQALLD